MQSIIYIVFYFSFISINTIFLIALVLVNNSPVTDCIKYGDKKTQLSLH